MNSDRNPSAAISIPISFPEIASDVSGQVTTAFTLALSAQSYWQSTPLRERLKRLRVLRALIAVHAHELAESSASARSRPVSEALVAEVVPLAEACRFLEKHARRI